MTTTDTRSSGKSTSMKNIRSVAVPAEHGGWGFLSEPIVLGMIVAPSLAGAGIALGAVAVFLLHQPLKIAVKDQRKGRVYARTRMARRFAAAYGIVAVAGFGLALAAADGAFWLPLVLAVPLAAIQLMAEFRNEGRGLSAEVFGALALGATAPALVLAAGHPPQVAAAAWLCMALRIVPSIFYVRTRLRLIHRKPASRSMALGAHIGAVLIGAAMWLGEAGGVLVVIAAGMLLARALYGLLLARPVAARVVGMQEVAFGLLFAVMCGAGLT